MKHLAFILFFIIALSCCLPVSAQELGQPFIRNYSAKEYNAGSTMFDVLQDRRGVLYFANSWNIREYDGVTWNDVHLTNQRSAYSLVLDNEGTIFVGGQNELGYLAPDPTGKLSFISLRDKVDSSIKDLGAIRENFSSPEGVFFASRNYVLRWKDGQVTTWTFSEGLTGAFYQGDFYINLFGKGLHRFNEDGFELVPGGELFKDKGISAGLDFQDDRLLITTRNEGVFISTHEQSFEPFPTDIDDYFRKHKITSGIKLASGAYAFGTFTGGAAIVTPNFDLMCFVDRGTGLQDQGIFNLYEDKDQILWLALRNGASRVEISTPINRWDESAGLQGFVRTIKRHQGVLFAGTTEGIYYLVSHDKGHSEFHKVTGIDSDVRSSILYTTPTGEEQLLCMTSDGFFQIEVKNGEGKAKKLFEPFVLQGGFIYKAHQPANRIFISNIGGPINVLHYKNGKWVNDGFIQNLNTDNIDIFNADYQGRGWGIKYGGKIRCFDIEFDGNAYRAVNEEIFGLEDGVPDDKFTNFALLKEDFILTSEKGVYLFNEDNKRFELATKYGDQLADYFTGFYFFEEDKRGNLWYYAYQMGDDIWHEVSYKLEDGTYLTDSVSLRRIPVTDSWREATYADNGAIWFGGTWGIYRYDDNQNWTPPTTFQAAIRKVTTGDDSLIFHGAFIDVADPQKVAISQNMGQTITVPYSANSLIFHFASNSYFDEAANEYSYKLTGSSYDSWSHWESETKEHIQNLREGDYVFYVKARNIYGIESDEASFSFTILPPWHRTTTAYIAYAMAAVFLVWLIVHLNTKRLKVQKQRLEKIVKDRTLEIQEQAEYLKHANEEVTAANEEILAKNEKLGQIQEELLANSEEISNKNLQLETNNRKITDSINYASRIQKAILGGEEEIAANFKNAFVLFQPKDIVSGDFYWFTECKNPESKQRKKILIAADCTGHGVPGAFMTVMGSSLLNEIVNTHQILSPNQILHELDDRVTAATHRQSSHQNSTVHDGMDMQVVSVDNWNAKLYFAGAKNHLYRVRKGEVEVFKGSKFPIGSSQFKEEKKFDLHELDMLPGDKYYIASDGYQDQFGGPEGKKFLRKRFRSLLLDSSSLTMEKQHQALEQAFVNWKGSNKQTDDILVIGFEV